MEEVKLGDIIPSEEDPYNGDLLDRKMCGEVLEGLAKTFSSGCVIALDGKWGTGKTTFVRMWGEYMKRNGYTVLSFNAWESDFVLDPLICLISEFKKATVVAGKDNVEKLTKAVAKISFAMLPALVGQIAKHLTGVDFQDMAKDAMSETVNILNRCVDDYAKQRESLDDFRVALSEYVESVRQEKPVIFIIDELDRCNPNYAVKTLERIKHLFSVKNVVFVLAIDMQQFCHSIRGYYGSEKIDADDYLRRFIDIQYPLPIGNIDKLIPSVLQKFDITESILKKNRSSYNSLDLFEEYVKMLYQLKSMSIRQLEKWLLHTRLVLCSTKRHISPETILFLVYLRLFESDFYRHFVLSEIDDQEVIYFFERIIPDAFFDVDNKVSMTTYSVIAELIRSRYRNNDDTFYKRVLSKEGNLIVKLSTDKINEKRLVFSFKEAETVPEISEIMKSVELVNAVNL